MNFDFRKIRGKTIKYAHKFKIPYSMDPIRGLHEIIVIVFDDGYRIDLVSADSEGYESFMDVREYNVSSR
jgi:hypothetical protein